MTRVPTVDTARYSRLFQSEGRELVSRLNESLLALERDADPLAHVQALFRAMHTMKGMAAAMGYGSMAAVAHAAEEVLERLREGSDTPDEALVDALFATADWLESALERVADDDAEPDASPVIALFVRVAESANTNSDRRVSVRLRQDAPLAGVRALMLLQAARKLGSVRAVVPHEHSLGDLQELRDLSFVFESACESSTIDLALRSVGDVEGVRVESISPDGVQKLDSLLPDATLQPKTPLPGVRDAHTSMARVEVRRLDSLMALTGELVIARGHLIARATELADASLLASASRLSRLVGELQEEVLATRMVQAGMVFDRFPRFVRDTARKLGKNVEFVLDGREIELDRALLDEIGEPLIHLLRNAVDHGLEAADERVRAGKPAAGRLTVAVVRERDGVVIRVSDDGRGVNRDAVLARARATGLVPAETAELSDDDLLRVLAASGLSTRESVTELSGRGVGVDAVVTVASRLGGTVDLKTTAGQGTIWSLRLPATLAIVRALLARVGNETYALPATHVRATADLADIQKATVRGRDVIVLGEDVLPVVRLREVVGLERQDLLHQDVVVLAAEDRRVGLLVDELLVQEEIVVKPFDAAREGARLFSGATVLPSGEPALIVDVGSLL
ncbi:MAG TPA: chemotaxis protein CheA [Gemmatimonadales bacterium]|nr:chemotaxis protein CheA [Gemmatimonadales bacterium]